VQGSSQWPTRALTPTVRRVPNYTSATSMTAHKRARAFSFLFLFFRFTILPDAGTDAVLGQQAHDIWSRELGDARCAALGGCRRRRPGSVRAILALLLLPFAPPPPFFSLCIGEKHSSTNLVSLRSQTGHVKMSKFTKHEQCRLHRKSIRGYSSL